jgi:hypothetical protein
MGALQLVELRVHSGWSAVSTSLDFPSCKDGMLIQVTLARYSDL